MATRLTSTGANPVGQTVPVAGIEATGQPRQQASQPTLASLLGKSLQAQVLARLPDGSFVVRINDLAARLSLPPGTQLGTQLPLTLVALTPRPTFQLQTGQGSAFAETRPAPPEGDFRQALPLSWIGGGEAAPVRAAAMLATSLAAARLPEAGADTEHASISAAGKLLGEVIAAAQKDGAAAAVAGRTPLLAAPSADAARVAAALQEGLAKSGLFYEAHVAEWAQGARPLADLAAEPQARGMPPPSDPATAQLINQQLNAHEQARVAWQGQLWPGQELRWEIERDAPEREPGRHDGDGDGDGARGSWQSSLRLRFGQLGEVKAQVVLTGDQLHIRLDAPESARALLEAGSGRLADALAAAGTPLNTLAIHGDDERR
ncbi:flagellar hook-length control protein FliK [Massilia sp. 2TAF26]|uniref:flagellar hook-length control protein FliK n=1 Tax=Massilia sp. 2TAF26 TaxID=3233012 RepID=UPI003F99E2B1